MKHLTQPLQWYNTINRKHNIRQTVMDIVAFLIGSTLGGLVSIWMWGTW